VYTVNGYGASVIPAGLLPRELAFLERSVDWALEQEEPDTIGELVDSLVGLGTDDSHPHIEAARRFLLDTQDPDGTWGRDDDPYGRFHTIWTAIDGLRDHHHAPACSLRHSAR
jgi:hypothetical protein